MMEHTGMAGPHYKRWIGVLLCLVLTFGYLVTADAATTVRFGDNTGDDFPGTVEDAMITNTEGAELTNYGGKPNINVEERPGGVEKRRSLIRFMDIAESIGAGKIITSATMHLYCNSEAAATDYSISAYRVLLNWREDNVEGEPMPGGTNWNYARFENYGGWNWPGCNKADDNVGEDEWNPDGADRWATATPVYGTTITGTGQYFSWDLTAAAQNWYSGDWSEYGVILICDSKDLDTKKNFSSSENEADGQRPYLEVTYELDPAFYEPYNSHITHFTSDKGPHLPVDESGCTTCHAAGSLQCGENGPFFNPGIDAEDLDGDGKFNLSETRICDPCHSPGGAFDGVGKTGPATDPDYFKWVAYGAKLNWKEGVYKADFPTLKDGKGGWCAGCHDDGSAVTQGVSAPNVIGDNASYGFNVTGHGSSNIDLECSACHDLTLVHTDGRQRTYSATADYVAHPEKTYKNGYRLNEDMAIPRDREVGASAFALCTSCHVYSDIVSNTSGFRDDLSALQWHKLHLEDILIPRWDSDWNAVPGDPNNYLPTQMGGPIDSNLSCPACHNVHGSPTPAMTRHGELISAPGTTDKVPALDFKWFKVDGETETFDREESWYGRLIAGPVLDAMDNHICTDCHRHDTVPPFDEWVQDGYAERYYRCVEGPEGILLLDVWTSDGQGMNKDIFQPNEPIRYHVSFTVTGCEDSYVVRTAEGTKAKSTSGTFWKTVLIPKDETLPANTYEWYWDETIPAEASQPSTAKVVMRVKMILSDGTVRIPEGVHHFTIE